MAQHEVLSPLPGIFYRRPAPEKPPYKDDGDKVADFSIKLDDLLTLSALDFQL